MRHSGAMKCQSTRNLLPYLSETLQIDSMHCKSQWRRYLGHQNYLDKCHLLIELCHTIRPRKNNIIPTVSLKPIRSSATEENTSIQHNLIKFQHPLHMSKYQCSVQKIGTQLIHPKQKRPWNCRSYIQHKKNHNFHTDIPIIE